MEIYRDNGKENGKYYNGYNILRHWGLPGWVVGFHRSHVIYAETSDLFSWWVLKNSAAIMNAESYKKLISTTTEIKQFPLIVRYVFAKDANETVIVQATRSDT